MSVKLVFRKDRNKWQVTYWIEGKRKRPLFDEKSEALNFARKAELGLDESRDRKSITIDSAIKSYYADHTLIKKGKVSHTTDKRYFNLLFHFLTEVRGLEYLKSVKLQDLETFQVWLGEQMSYDGKPMKMGPATVNRAFNSIRHLFKKHVQWGSIDASPAICLDRLNAEENQRRAMTSDEFVLALKKAPEWFKPVFTFIHLCGTPPSCIERLTWEDVDFAGCKYTIKRMKGREGKLKRISLPLTDAAAVILLELRSRYKDGVLAVFRNEDGHPLNADRCSKVGNDAIRSAGLSGVVLYGLRHGLATDLTNANVSIEIVRQALGHASITTTQRYVKQLKSETLTNALSIVRGGLVAV